MPGSLIMVSVETRIVSPVMFADFRTDRTIAVSSRIRSLCALNCSVRPILSFLSGTWIFTFEVPVCGTSWFRNKLLITTSSFPELSGRSPCTYIPPLRAAFNSAEAFRISKRISSVSILCIPLCVKSITGNEAGRGRTFRKFRLLQLSPLPWPLLQTRYSKAGLRLPPPALQLPACLREFWPYLSVAG